MFGIEVGNRERITVIVRGGWEWAIKYPLPKFIPLLVGGLEIELRIV